MPVNEENFQVSNYDYIDTLLENYEKQKANLIEVHAAFDLATEFNLRIMEVLGVKKPKLEKMLHLLNVDYWGDVYRRSNIATYLDTEKRQQWASDLHLREDNKAELPEFNRENIISTLTTWFSSRTDFFIDRIELLFKNLSKTHITNSPQGFSQKMIFTNACDTIFSTPKDMRPSSYMLDILFDLAGVISAILNIPTPPHSFKNGFKDLAAGVKYSFFGDTFELQIFKNGNIHIWIHPQIAIDLNLWLAKRYPSAIATENRTKPIKEQIFTYRYDYLTEHDFTLLSDLQTNSNMFRLSFNKELHGAAARFAKFAGLSLEDLFKFERCHGYDKVASEILRKGYPNIKDHQFYATPKEITECINAHLEESYADQLNEMTMLEPSAGTGKLVEIHPAYSTQVHCVEVSPLFSTVLQAKGVQNVHNIDFMKFKHEFDYDLIIMNPPYASKQLEKHINKALSHLKNGGELIAVIPNGKVSQIKQMDGFEGLKVISTHSNTFEDTSISTAVISIFA